MNGEMKLTLSVTDEVNQRLEQIGDEMGITKSEVLRRAIGLVSVTHNLLQEEGDDLFICARNEEGVFRQRHVLSTVLF